MNCQAYSTCIKGIRPSSSPFRPSPLRNHQKAVAHRSFLPFLASTRLTSACSKARTAKKHYTPPSSPFFASVPCDSRTFQCDHHGAGAYSFLLPFAAYEAERWARAAPKTIDHYYVCVYCECVSIYRLKYCVSRTRRRTLAKRYLTGQHCSRVHKALQFVSGPCPHP